MVDFIHKLVSLIPGDVVLAGVGVIVEAALRLVPSQKPLSILYMIDDAAKALGEFLGKVGTAMDHVLPQRLAATATDSKPQA